MTHVNDDVLRTSVEPQAFAEQLAPVPDADETLVATHRHPEIARFIISDRHWSLVGIASRRLDSILASVFGGASIGQTAARLSDGPLRSEKVISLVNQDDPWCVVSKPGL